MSTEHKQVSERELVLAQRDAFAEGVRYGHNDVVSVAEIVRRYPLPKTTRPREEMFGHARLRVVLGNIEWWCSSRGWLSAVSGPNILTEADAQRLLDLFQHPLEEVDDDGEDE